VLVPVLAYIVLRHTLHSDLIALAVTEAIPIAWVLGTGLRRGRVDPVALAAACVLGVAFLVSLASGGSSMPIKLRRAAVTGTLGVICLVSVAIGRPVLPPAMRWLGEWFPRVRRLADLLSSDQARRKADVLTTIIGVALLADGVAELTLALTVSTTTFLGASRLARISLLAAGFALCVAYLRRTGGPAPAASSAPDARTGDP
jgi:hypothetical protein